MKTLGVLADVHGNAPALQAVVAELAAEVDTWVCAGDIAGHLPMVDETVAILREIGARCVRGNHDAALLTGAAIPGSSAATRALQIQRAILSPGSREWLASLPERLDLDVAGIRVSIVHGGPDESLGDKIAAGDPEARRAAQGRVLVLGNTHRPVVEVGDGWAVLNPGSVGLPVDGNPRARALLLRLPERWVRLVEVPYDPGPVLARMALLGYDARYARCVRQGRWTGWSAADGRISLLVVGASTYGRTIADLITSRADLRLVGFVDDTPALQERSVGGVPVLGPIEALAEIAARTGVSDVALAIGENRSRRSVADRVRRLGVRLATLTHASAQVAATATLGAGVVVDAMSHIAPGCVIEEGVAVWQHVTVGHDSRVGAYASLKPGCIIGGGSTVHSEAKLPLGSIWPAHSVIPDGGAPGGPHRG